MLRGSHSGVTTLLGYGPDRVCFASNKDRSSGTTVFKVSTTYNGGNVIADAVRRPTMLDDIGSTTTGGGRYGFVPISAGNIVSVGTTGGLTTASVKLISTVLMGGRANIIRPVSRLTRVTRSTNTCVRASTIRSPSCAGVSLRGLGISSLSLSTRGFNNPGKVKVLFLEAKAPFRGFVRNKRRRHSHHTNARGVTFATNYTGTLRLACGNFSRGGRGVSTLEQHFRSTVGSSFPRTVVGNRSTRHYYSVSSMAFPNISTSDVVVGLSFTKVYVSTKDTYTSNSIAPSRILATVKVKRTGTGDSIHISFNGGGAPSRASFLVGALSSAIGELGGVWVANRL